MKKIFIDANIFIDIFNINRKFNKESTFFYKSAIESNYKLFTSCDLITTIYYIDSKQDKKQALLNIQNINKTLKVIELSNKEIDECCNLMLEDSSYHDLEDTIQYIMAKKHECNLIISNDKNFVIKDIEVMTSEDFCKRYVQ